MANSANNQQFVPWQRTDATRQEGEGAAVLSDARHLLPPGQWATHANRTSVCDKKTGTIANHNIIMAIVRGGER